MTRSYLLRGKSDLFDGLSEATPSELLERWHEEGPRGGNSGKKQLCDNRCYPFIGEHLRYAHQLSVSIIRKCDVKACTLRHR